MINRIHFHTFGGGLISWEAYNQIYIYFLFTEVGLWLGRGGRGAYQCGSLEAAVYFKRPVLFSAFNMTSDWISWFNFTEGVKGFHCWFLMIFFHGLAGITLLSFATAMMTSQSVTQFSSQSSPRFSKFSFIVFIQFTPAMFIQFNPWKVGQP